MDSCSIPENVEQHFCMSITKSLQPRFDWVYFLHNLIMHAGQSPCQELMCDAIFTGNTEEIGGITICKFVPIYPQCCTNTGPDDKPVYEPGKRSALRLTSVPEACFLLADFSSCSVTGSGAWAAAAAADEALGASRAATSSCLDAGTDEGVACACCCCAPGCLCL